MMNKKIKFAPVLFMFISVFFFSCGEKNLIKNTQLQKEKKSEKLFFIFSTNNFNSRIIDTVKLKYNSIDKEGWQKLLNAQGYIYYRQDVKKSYESSHVTVNETAKPTNIMNIQFDNGKYDINCYKANGKKVINKIMELKGYDVYITGKLSDFTYKIKDIEFNSLLDILRQELALSIEKRETGFYINPYQDKDSDYESLNWELVNQISSPEDSIIFTNNSRTIINYNNEKILFYNRNKKLYNIIKPQQFKPKNFKSTQQYFRISDDGSFILLVLKSTTLTPELYNYYFAAINTDGKKLWECYFNNYHKEYINISPEGSSVLIILDDLSDTKFPPALRLIFSKRGKLLYKSSEWFSQGILFNKNNTFALQFRKKGTYIFDVFSKKLIPFQFNSYLRNNLKLAPDYLKVIAKNDYRYYFYNTGKLANRFSFSSRLFLNNDILIKDKYGIAKLYKSSDEWVVFDIFNKEIFGTINLKDITGKGRFKPLVSDKKDVIFFYQKDKESNDIFIYDIQNMILKRTKIFEGLETIKFCKLFNNNILIITDDNTYMFNINDIIKNAQNLL